MFSKEVRATVPSPAGDLCVTSASGQELLPLHGVRRSQLILSFLPLRPMHTPVSVNR